MPPARSTSRSAASVVAILVATVATLALLAKSVQAGPGDAAPGDQASAPTVTVGGKPAASAPSDGEKENPLVESARKFAPILILILVVAVVIASLPKVPDVQHSRAFRRRRAMNWLPLGLTYAFLYMGRYNLTVSKKAFEKMEASSFGSLADHAHGAISSAASMMGNDAFSIIFGAGTIIYGVSFVVNGPLTDRLGGKIAMLIGAGGAAIANLLMGLCALTLLHHGPYSEVIARHFTAVFAVLYGLDMYFQSFGAVAIVKVNAAWFHVRERGVFGAIFGILISLGIYFAFDWSALILGAWGLAWVFLAPAALLATLWILDVALVKNSPGEAGHADFDTADASSGDDGPRLGALAVFMLMLRNPIIMTIACIEFCSGFLRQAIMQWYQNFARQTDAALGFADSFANQHWGLLLCCAGILGGVVAGVISDHVFGSRRGPVAFLLYAVMLIGAVVMTFTYQTPVLGALVITMSMAVIGVHGMLSGTASMDFGGKKNVGVAVGIIDGFVYLGTGTMSVAYYFLLPEQRLDEAGKLSGPATDPDNWLAWPISMIVLALVGTLFARRVWNAMPRGKGASSGH